MTDHRNSLIPARLAKRVSLLNPGPSPTSFKDTPAPEGLYDCLREHLASGETHYTTRPGLTELRQSIGREISRLGGPDRQADGVIVTQGEGEALYVTLLGLGIGAESVVVAPGDCRHRGLFDQLGIEVVDGTDPKAGGAVATYGEVGEEVDNTVSTPPDGCFEILALGDLLFSTRSGDASLSALSSDTILIGHLDSLPGLDHFRLAYVSGPPNLVKKIQTWKQALSICSAAPSQRAAMFAISQESAS